MAKERQQKKTVGVFLFVGGGSRVIPTILRKFVP
jgi:hypothetical protein